MGAFGDKFRAERERRGFTLDDVSNVTKISARMLKAIEEEHFDQLPGGVFNKGFVRAYAKHLQLNDEEAVTDYLACLRQAQIDAQTAAWEPERQRPLPTPTPPKPPAVKPASTPAPAAQKPQPAKPAPHVPRPGVQVEELPELQLPNADHIHTSRKLPSEKGLPAIPWQVPAIVLLVLLIGVALWNRHSRSARAEGTYPPGALQGTPNAAQNTPSAAPPSPTSKPGAPSLTSAPSTSAPPSTATSATSPGNSSVTTSAAIQQPDPAEQDAQNDVSKYPAPSSGNSSGPKTSQGKTSATKPPPTFTLTIRAAENSWISVAADGQNVTQETLIAPAHTSVRATREIVVQARNAAAVSFLFNGKEIPATGAEGEAKTFVFDTTGLIPAPATDAAH